MHSNEYRAIIYSKGIYQEIEMKPRQGTVRIGTTKECDIRLNTNLFFEKIMLAFVYEEGKWKAECAGNLYFADGSVLKRQTLELDNGMKFSLCYIESGADVFQIEILYNYEQLAKYDARFAFPQSGILAIGGNGACDVEIRDEIVADNYIVLKRQGEVYRVDSSNSGLGVYLNGTRYMGSVEAHNYDFIMLGGYGFFLKGDYVYTQHSMSVFGRSVQLQSFQEEKYAYTYPHLNRSTRIQYVVPEEQIELLGPEEPAEDKKKSLLMLLIPALVSLALTVVLRGFMGGGGTFVIYSVCTMTMGTVMSVINFMQEKKERKREEEERVGTYLQYINEKQKYIAAARQNELRILKKKYISLQEEVEVVNSFAPSLFEKSQDDADFMTVRYGYGTIASVSQISYKPQEFASHDALAYYPEQIAASFKYIEQAPVVSDLKKKGSVGIVGARADIDRFVRTLLMDIIIRHQAQDVKIICFGSDNNPDMEWLRWVRNNMDESTGRRLNVVDEESRNAIIDFLYSELNVREAMGETVNQLTYYVVVVRDTKQMENHPLLNYVKNSAARKFSFLFLSEYQELLPAGLAEIVYIRSDGKGEYVDCQDGDKIQSFSFETMGDETAVRLAHKLAAVELGEISLASALTKNISLYKLLKIKGMEDLNLEDRWAASQVYKSMAAPLGVRAGDEIVYLDLNEKAHGPHGLVAGTTGSGKSEILQTYILSIATLFHPYEVAFVIIDFKGGGMVNQFKQLPHLVGAITNIDGKEIDRSLLSIRAELRKRQQCFAQAGVNHIDNYIKKYKSGECSVPLPHLILIVDEFAELKSDQPEFMKELISTARIGRSLGVHLILATQKPSGVVNDQIWSNSKFKLCLKVQNKEDSNEVLKSPLAAEIREPGRAYLQVGNNEIFELFQSAYSGASVRSEEAGNIKKFSVAQVDFSGKKNIIFQQQVPQGKEENRTQLEALVDYIHVYCSMAGIEALPGLCMPPLPDRILYDERKRSEVHTQNITVTLGLYDDPENQFQGDIQVDLTANNLFILGAAQYGKTNLLQLIVRSVAERYTPLEANIYILDFSSMILKNFEKLAHVSGVVLASEDDKMKTFMKLMLQELKSRKEILSGLGISSFSAYKEAGYSELPQIIVLIDNFSAFRELFSDYEDGMLNLMREGVTVGITFCVTNSQTNGMGYRYLANFAKRLSLYCNDSNEYSSLFDRCRVTPNNTVGRALTELDKQIYELQTYLSFEGDKEIERVRNMRQFVSEMNERYAGMHARQLPVIPQVVTEEFLLSVGAEARPYSPAFAVDYDTMEVLCLELDKMNVLSICGRERSGKTNILSHILAYANHNMFSLPTKVFLLDGSRRQLHSFRDMGIVQEYTIDTSMFSTWVDELYDELKKRYERVAAEGLQALDGEPLLCYVIENRDSIGELAKDASVLGRYKEILNRYKGMKFLIIYSDLENAGIAYGSPEPLKLLKDNRNLLFCDELANMKILDVTNAQIKAFKKEISIGDAFYFRGNEVRKVKIVKNMEG